MQDEEGFEIRLLNRSTWKTPVYFSELAPIGSGAFGSVCQAIDQRTNSPVAIKKLQKPFQDSLHAQRAYREIKLLRYMDHENVIGLVDLFKTKAPGSPLPDIYIVTDLMGSDLHTIIQSQYVSEEHVQFLTYQIFRALLYVHSAGIIHRDLKPSNIAVNQDCDLKILDFGLARTAQPDGGMTGYVATRWYRAPEIMLNWGKYSAQVDLWSIGCILAELLTNRPLFQGQDHIEQLNAILQLVGKPTPEFIQSIENEHARNYIASLPDYPRQDFTDFFRTLKPDISDAAIDILERLIVFDPDQRLTAAQALQHPFMERFHDPEDEPVASSPFDCSFEDVQLEAEQWKNLVIEEIDDYVAQQYANIMQQAVDNLSV